MFLWVVLDFDYMQHIILAGEPDVKGQVDSLLNTGDKVTLIISILKNESIYSLISINEILPTR